jgi:hypothetical protein
VGKAEKGKGIFSKPETAGAEFKPGVGLGHVLLMKKQAKQSRRRERVPKFLPNPQNRRGFIVK